MEFYPEKVKIFRKQIKYTVTNFCKVLNISRTTLWQWETGKRHPSKENIYHIASVLNVSVSEISDLPPQKFISDMDLHPSAISINKIAGTERNNRQRRFKNIHTEINALEEDIERVVIIVKGLLDSLDAMFYVKDPELKYIIVNKSFLKSLSLHINYNVIGKTDLDFFNKKEAEFNLNQDKSVLRSGISIHNQERFIPGTRKHRVGLISKLPITDKKGAIIGLVGLFVDITEEKKNRQLLEILEYNINKIKDGVVISSSNKHLYLNKATESIFEYPLSKLKNESINFVLRNCFYEEDSKKEIEYWQNEKWPNKDVSRIITPSGKIKWVEITRSRNDYLGKLCNISVIRDITESIHLKDTRDLFIKAINESEDAFALVSYFPEEIKYFYSKGIEKLTGISVERLDSDKTAKLEKLVHPEDKDKFITTRQIKELLIAGKPISRSTKFRIIDVNGKIKWIECRFFFIKEYNIFHIGGLYRDISYLVRESNNIQQVKKTASMQTKLDIAKKMKNENISIELISKITNISMNDIDML
jgi:PAS domain S-box-containing protein